jgi:hypothetical protein
VHPDFETFTGDNDQIVVICDPGEVAIAGGMDTAMGTSRGDFPVTTNGSGVVGVTPGLVATPIADDVVPNGWEAHRTAGGMTTFTVWVDCVPAS